MRQLRPLSRLLLAVLFVGGGVLHFTATPVYLKVMPPYLPHPRLLVYLSGACEIAGGIGVLLPPPVCRWAGWGLIALLVAVFPANVHMAMHRDSIPGLDVQPFLLWLRLPLQLVLIAWVAFATGKAPDKPQTR
uniref:DoxX family membrane protein n=1 Tax=uncultured Armatimonadetes bacterium TaxID=157466 RepID=A0A6J4J819_9BACT|nr:hypothetical protein AVDCRST_MAG63-2854 [uncultured Armatimonadetes bacterium]